MAEQLQQRWPQQYEELRTQIEAFRAKGKTLEDQVRIVRKNPLRNLKALHKLQEELATANEQLLTLQKQLEALPTQIEVDRQAVLTARQHDEQFLRDQLQFTDLDGEGITQTLLGKPTSQALATSLDWIAWARSKVPSKRDHLPPSRTRGTEVIFGQAKPKFWIKQLQLAGQAQLGGEPLLMVGALTNATSDPHLVAEPTKLSLTSNDGKALVVDLTLDRRTETASDHLHIACPQLNLNGQTIGSEDKLAIQVAPSMATFHVDLTVTGDQLAGEIVYQQPDAQLQVASRSEKNQRLISALGSAIQNVNQIEANITLAGTLESPEFNLQSDLGHQLAAGINSSVKKMLAEQSEKLLASTREKVDAQLNQLAEARTKTQTELLAKLGEHQQFLTQLAALSQGGSIPQLSRSLGVGTLRK